MSSELTGAVQHLAKLLRRHFVLYGNPPRSVRWEYDSPVPILGTDADDAALKSRFLDIAEDCLYFHCLLDDPRSEYVEEAIANIPPLAEVADVLRDVSAKLETSPGQHDRLRYLFRKLCERQWSECVQIGVSVDGGKIVRHLWGYDLVPIEVSFLQDLRNAARPPAFRCDKPKKIVVKHPDNPDVRDLCRLLSRGSRGGKSLIQIAREFTKENPPKDPKARNLLRQAQRFRHLWRRDDS